MIPASRRARFIAIAVVLLLLIAGGAIILTLIAPQSSESIAQDADTRPDCLTDTDGTCLTLPTFSGTDLNDTTYTFPEALGGDYQLIVMPFDRDQQVRAATWLEPFREIASNYERVEYYSIAALPDLSPAIRGLVVSGMRFNVQDDLTRARLIVVFLENQPAFLEILNITDTDTIRLFITDADGTLYWQGSGDYNPSTEDDLREALARLAG
jgi:hypothetical protein